MDLVALVDEVLLVQLRPLVVLRQVVQLHVVDEQARILKLIEHLHQFVNLYVLTCVILLIIYQVHMLDGTYHDK